MRGKRAKALRKIAARAFEILRAAKDPRGDLPFKRIYRKYKRGYTRKEL